MTEQPVGQQPDARTRIAHALRSIVTVGGCPPTRLVPVLDVANPRMARIAAWQPLDTLVDALLAATAPAPVPSAPADRAALRDRIAALFRCPPGAERLGDATPGEIADAVSDDLLAAQLAPLEAQARAVREQQRAAVRAEVLREAADIAEAQRQFKRATGPRWSAQVSENVGILRVADELRRMADEAEYVAAPCSAGGCEPGGEPCTTHERLMAHAEGDHELCAPDCGPGGVAGETQQAETQARRGDAIEGWLKAQRDEYHSTVSPQWLALDDVLDTYRLHADTGTPLGGHVCEGRTVGDCDCLEPHLTPSGNVRIDHLLRAEQSAAVSQPETEA